MHPGTGADIMDGGNHAHLANSAGDWGKSNPLAVPEFIQEMKRRGTPRKTIHRIVYDNPLAFFRQSQRWREGGKALRRQKQKKNQAPRKKETDIIQKAPDRSLAASRRRARQTINP